MIFLGINKHFQMMAIHDKFTSSLNCELSAKEIWKKLETYYDLQALVSIFIVTYIANILHLKISFYW